MAKKNNFISASISFEDFENTQSRAQTDLSADELLQQTQAAEAAARKKEAELKKAYQRKKRQSR